MGLEMWTGMKMLHGLAWNSQDGDAVLRRGPKSNGCFLPCPTALFYTARTDPSKEAVSHNLHLMLSILFLKKTSPKHSERLARQSIVLLSTVTGGDMALDFGLQGEDKAACLPQWVRSASLSHLTEHLSPGGR